MPDSTTPIIKMGTIEARPASFTRHKLTERKHEGQVVTFDYNYIGEVSAVVGGPVGDYRPDATENAPGGVIEKGWPQGKRNSYADDVFIYDENEYQLNHAQIVTLDNEWAIAVYVSPLDQVSAYYDERHALKAALLRREGDAYLTVQKDVMIDDYYESSDREGLASTRLNSTDVCIGYAQWNADLHITDYSLGNPAVVVLRRVGEQIEAVAYHRFWTEWDSYWHGLSNEKAVHEIVRITDTKFVVLHVRIDEFFPQLHNTIGTLFTDTFHTIGATVCERIGTEILVGEGISFTPDWDKATGYMVTEDRIVLMTGYEAREEFLERNETPISGRYQSYAHIRTCDIDGLSITENKNNGLICSDQLAYSSLYSDPRIVMMSNTEGIAVFDRMADINQPMDYLGGGMTDPDNWGTAPRLTSLDHLISNNFRAQQHPCALRFSVGSDGSVSTSWLPHLLDVGVWNYRRSDPGYWGVGSYTTNNVIGYSAELVGDRVLVTWAVQNTQPSNCPWEWANGLHISSVAKATWLAFDDDSASGIAPSGYRHLGVSNYSYDYMNLHIRHFPNSDWFTAANVGYLDYHLDGPGLSPEYYGGFSAVTNGRWFWDEYSGFNPELIRSEYTGVPPDYYAYYMYPYFDHIAYNDWEDQNVMWRYPDKYGLDPWEVDPGFENEFVYWNGAGMTLQCHLWRIGKSSEAHSGEVEGKVYRP